MNEPALGTMTRSRKGPLAAPPVLTGALGDVARAVTAWPDVVASVHWELGTTTVVDGIDFYAGELELGHLHLDGSLHLATNPTLGGAIVAEGLARPFPYVRGWVHEDVERIGAPAAIALFRRNYDRLAASAAA